MKGQSFSFKRAFSEDDVLTFADLVGDQNPLHTDPVYASKTSFGKPIVHGMLVASLFSTLVGMLCPGEKCLYLGQSIKFTKPVFPNDLLTVSGTVMLKIESLKMLKMSMEIFCRSDLVVKGESQVKFLEENSE